MLPRLDHLSLLPTGVRSPNLPDDLVSAVLDAVAAGDTEDACQAAASWCAVDSGNNRVCNENWERLTNLVFANAPVVVPNNARANFYALCNRARSYRMKRRRLNASSSQEDGDVKVFVLAALSWDIKALPWVSPRLRADPEVQLSTKELEYRNGYRMLSKHPEDQSVRRLVLAAFDAGRALDLDDVSEELRSDPQVLLAYLTRGDDKMGMRLEKEEFDESVPEELKNDRSFVLELARLGEWNVLNVVPERFQKDREVVLAAVQSNGLALAFALEQFSNDREIVIAALEEDGTVFSYVSEDLRKDREIVMIALASLNEYCVGLTADKHCRSSNPMVLYNVPSKELKNDRELVLTAVRYDGSEFEFASDELKNDREFVLEAMKHQVCAFVFASKELRDDDEVVAKALFYQSKCRRYYSRGNQEYYYDSECYCRGAHIERLLNYASKAQQRKYDQWEKEYREQYDDPDMSNDKMYHIFMWERYQDSASR